MRLVEFASAEEQMALWKLVSDSVWTSIAIQAQQEEKAKAAQRRKAKSKRTTRQATVPVRPVSMPKLNQPAPVPPPQQPQKQPIKPQPVSGFGSIDGQISQKPISTQSPVSQ
ncbi:MAG: hypothetical protein EBT06_14850 [Gammaproteobacteria bacterium]|nr:hypothetical protein [Gammaproteobacteria bacterium]NBT46142.1 hypothetical protein [Gammaproteobacteria bacterium]